MHSESIRVGILFSLTGCTAITEVGQYRSALLAIQQINQTGGIHDLPIEAFVEDIASDPILAREKARKLIEQDKVQILVGPYTSACRKEVIPVLKQYNILLFYPTLYEGNEQNNWIYYTGALPNQQLQFFIPWIISHLGMSFYLVGSDYIFPRITNQHMHELLKINGGRVNEESYASLGTQNFEQVLSEIEYLKPDVVFSTLVGDSAVSFYQQFYQNGFEQPICSPITAETEITAMHHEYSKNIFSSFPYFNTVKSLSNKTFIQAYEKQYSSKVISSVMQNTYNSIYLLKDAVQRANKLDTDSIRRSLNQSSFDSPQGYIRFDENNHHLWQGSRIGHITERGNFEIVWESDSLIAPTPFMSYAQSNLPIKKSFFNNKFKKRVISDDQLKVRQSRWKDYMPFLYQLPQFYQYQFFLLDPDGILIDKLNNDQVPLSNKGIGMGTNWLSDFKGKNGFGMALACKKTYIMQGEQHDYASLNDSVTAGIPIIHDKNCLGVIGILADLDDFRELSSQLDSLQL
ncbi:transporter substrate-binding protein [Sporolactobacillus sp. Y61]|uniref:Transporter substrate-binding protein n=1 Tax=Sporolactobacillus sp. Y61 TaxID=3160863 RepID=A0AAU8IFL7_9BACL